MHGSLKRSSATSFSPLKNDSAPAGENLLQKFGGTGWASLPAERRAPLFDANALAERLGGRSTVPKASFRNFSEVEGPLAVRIKMWSDRIF
jgi:hypothetical protein